MATLNLSTVELVTTLRSAPQNGPTSSQDYNDSWTEALADLASLSGFINDIVIPMLNGLVSTILPNPQGTPNGLEGRYIFTDTSDLTAVFFNSLSNNSLSIADSFRVLNGIITTVQTSINVLNVEVTALQTQLSTTNQNDIAQALQNLSASLQALQAQVNSNTQAISNLAINLFTNGNLNSVQTRLNLVAGSNVSLSESGGNVTITVPPATIPNYILVNSQPVSYDFIMLVNGFIKINATGVGGGALQPATPPGGQQLWP